MNVCKICVGDKSMYDKCCEEDTVKVDTFNIPQPAPKQGVSPAIWDLVTADMHERDKTGADKYGVRLQADNGRDFLIDAYQEALDLSVYLRGEIYKKYGR